IFNYEESPDQTSKGLPIDLLPHKADFLRTRVMKKWGGIYLDQDAYVIRDLAPLRYTGFQLVVGGAVEGTGNGMFLSTPENEMITAYHALQDTVFDGGWVTHSVVLLSRLVTEFVVIDSQVLVLEQEAFFPL